MKLQVEGLELHENEAPSQLLSKGLYKFFNIFHGTLPRSCILYFFVQFWLQEASSSEAAADNSVSKSLAYRCHYQYIATYNCQYSFNAITSQKLCTYRSHFRRSVSSVNDHPAIVNIFQKLYKLARISRLFT